MNDIESLRSFAHLCTEALAQLANQASEQWAVERIAPVLNKFAERDGDGCPPCDEDLVRVLATTDTTRPDGAIARRIEV